MKLYKKLTLGLIFVFITACGNSTTDGNDGNNNTALDAFARKLANNNTPTIYKSSSSYALISDNGKTITSGVGNAFDSGEVIGSTWTLTATNTTANTATYAKNGAANSSTDLVLKFDNINATPLVIATTGGVKYGGVTAVNNAALEGANNFISVLLGGFALTHDLDSGETILTGAFADIETSSGIDGLEVADTGAIPAAFGKDTAGDYTIETTLTPTTAGIKAVIVLIAKATGNEATEDLIRNTITIPNLEGLSADEGIELSGSLATPLMDLKLTIIPDTF